MKPLLLILVPTVLAACATQPLSEPREAASFRPAIEAANRQLMDAYNRGDTIAVARMYADDALMISDRGERYEGRVAIDKYWNPAPAPNAPPAKPGKWTLEVLSLEGTDTMPVQRGRSILVMEWQGKPRVSDVQFVVIWRKQPDGSYKIAVDGWWPTAK
jgi:ketosteroid isomerase-like protein